MKKITGESLLALLVGITLLNFMPVAAESPVSGYTAGYQLVIFVGLFFAIIVTAVVIGLLIYVLLRGHTKQRIKSEVRLEMAIIIFATVIVSIIFVVSIPAAQNIMTKPKEYDETVAVIGYQYNWTFIKEDGTRTTGQVNLEVGKVYLFNMTSLDVIHSFYSNELSIKVDIVPGRYNLMWLQVLKPGTYEVHCAEYCGIEHYSMVAYLIVE